ncbi:MobF family relaxase [Sphingomonas abaci]|uniref:Conjugative relaxase-like TrwC/TraI family protein n=1 Tax=Sphingomonas abaci TaxID=237611 RepID=A0A7W7AMF7_9SPHN|nr:MobF family relaxase [Sphingomonas abaci]MBB4619763.1 conjugative relaxase-like TrwC/TraI family protein [Sphingomonas abaci]
MISVNAVASAGNAANYYAKDNYYTADQAEGASAWGGEGAAALGLEGAVDAARFERILEGRLPDGSVIDARRGTHRPGWDLTMSVPKSVSILALVGGDARLIAAVREAATVTLGWIERNIVEGRVSTTEGQRAVRTGNVLAATFLHDVNRNGEPQLHVHNVLANATRMPDGSWKALHSDGLYQRQHVMGAVFASNLRARVEALGYATTPAYTPIDGAFDIAGVPRGVVEAFSTRSDEIDAHLEAHGRQGTARERELAALATRNAKTPGIAPAVRAEGWRTLAAENGFDPSRLVREALARSGREETMWTRTMRGIRGNGERGLAVVARMGLSPRDGDPLVPERLGRLDPVRYSAAQAVTSAARDLGESEAAFDRLDLIHAALERGGPVTVGDVEARIAFLEGRGLLLGDGDRMVTTESAVHLEQAYLASIDAGRGQGAAIVSPDDAMSAAQGAARDLGLRTLNAGQLSAAVLILSSSDRVVNIQGGPGRGKSAALAPVTAIAKAQGHHVIGLAIASRTATALGRDTGAETSTVAWFLARHARVIDGTASAAQLARVTTELKGAVIMVEEASQVCTWDMEPIVRLADMIGVARLVQVGDSRQLGAIAAGRPFEDSQRAGHATAYITENLRSRSDQMKGIVAALDGKDFSTVSDLLKPDTIEVAAGDVARVAAARWAALPKAMRDNTLLLTAGRAMRSEANQAVQAELKATGEIASVGTRIEVLDRVNATREGARLLKGYHPGRVVEIRTDLPSQGFVRGDRGVVKAIEGGRVRLEMRGGGEKHLQPNRLAKNLKHDAVSIYQPKQIELHAGDRIRWTDNDHDRKLSNADMARVEELGGGRLVVSSLVDGTVHELKVGDRMTERLDLAYAINVHIAQGVTSDHGMLVLRSSERRLLSERSFLVALTRIADKAALIVDDGRAVERGVVRNTGDKTSALETIGQTGSGTATQMPEPSPAINAAVERYARLFLTAEQQAIDGQPMLRAQDRELGAAAAALERARVNGAEDLRIVLDRELGSPGAGRYDPGQLTQAWMREGQIRTDHGAYAQRFIADWKAATADSMAAMTNRSEAAVERRQERLEDRMLREPALERALDRALPERQLSMKEPGSGGPGRDRDFGMEM